MSFEINKPQIYFRLDFGGCIGRGHLSRCLALAEAFKVKNFFPIFVIRKRPNILNEKLPFKTIWLAEGADVCSSNVEEWRVGTCENEASELLQVIEPNSLIVLDHYALDISFQKILRSKNHKLVLMQDVYNENFAADVLVNYNIGAIDDYINLTDTKLLVGTQYAPLQENYSKEHFLRFESKTKVEVVGLYLGGIEKKYLELVALAISKLDYFSDKKIEWVVTSHEDEILLRRLLIKNNVEFHVQLPNLLDLYKRAQLFIGAFGISFLERACVGIWQLNFLVADNQKNIASNVSLNNFGVSLGDIRVMCESELCSELKKYLDRDREISAMEIKNAFDQIDGRGAFRIVEHLLKEAV